MVLIVAVGAGALAFINRSDGTPRFVDETVSSGLAHTYAGGDVDQVGGGVAVFDCDQDGKPDAFLAGGFAPSALFRNDSFAGGALRFTRLPDPVTDVDAIGAYPLDVDGDAVSDLVVLRLGESLRDPLESTCRHASLSIL